MGKKIVFKGKKTATLALHAKHKSDGSAILTIYPLLYSVKRRKPLTPDAYDKKDVLAKIKFANTKAIGDMLSFITRMYNDNLFLDGQRRAYDDANAQVHQMLNDAFRYIDILEKQVMSLPKRPVVNLKTGEGFANIPDEVFNKLVEGVTEEIQRRKKPEEQKQEPAVVASEQQ